MQNAFFGSPERRRGVVPTSYYGRQTFHGNTGHGTIIPMIDPKLTDSILSLESLTFKEYFSDIIDIVDEDTETENKTLYVLPLKKRHNLLYLKVTALESEILALVDSGASSTFIGKEVYHRAITYGVELINNIRGNVTTAVGVVEPIKGWIKLSIKIKRVAKQLTRVAKQLTVRVLDKLDYDLILGIDVLEIFEINIDFSTCT
ncbi:hypothetical protein TSAR_016422 [Trichomalopsis sarcophagae]|uniref:Aspartic peptidase DDI1-type domain-containing protein n=1 Tax=Trichomalopsis sarcophagae TaxID=543379 RepID=A0A232EQ13_9HYME|nr:hypothetical protein TSAR_016422 [Trichomalopsis sarcophagae]